MDILQSTTVYEDWLRNELTGGLIEKDLDKKHAKMKDSAFVFLRATYWYWAESIFDVCPDLSNAPDVLAVGDIHVENFGTWRDVDGRLVWGVNDFDEAADMPFVIDLVRLAVSALLGRDDGCAASQSICNAILEGYTKGLGAPKPFVLDRDHRKMREIFVVSEDERADFWRKINGTKNADERQPDQRYLDGLMAAMPAPDVPMKVWPRTAGTGSLGRPRWVALSEWKGGPVVREAKAAVPSAWGRVPGRNVNKAASMKLARGLHRTPDPWYQLTEGNVIVRRLSPNTRKIEIDKHREVLLEDEMLEAMGRELANLHLGVMDRSAAIQQDLSARGDGWLVRATENAADATKREFERWKRI
jgi:uncharacterized protein (DUF2252 family)